MGLLIALSLEQTVEAVHRHHERTVLRRDIHAEASDNIKRLERGRKNTIANALWLRSLVKLLRDAPLVDGKITVTVPAAPNGSYTEPTRAAWTIAKANGTLGLLPEDETVALLQLDYWTDTADATTAELRKYFTALNATQTALGVTFDSGATLHLTPVQRDAVIQMLSNLESSMEDEAAWLADCEGANEAIAAGAKTRAEVERYAEVRDQETASKF